MLLSVGFSRGCITPKDNVSIYNLDGQSRNSKDILDDLYVNTIVLESDERLLLFISLDIIWVDYKFTKRIKDRLYSEIGISDSNILICATHSHSTPQIAYHVNNEARPDKSYIDLIINIVCERSIFSFNNRVSAKARYSSFSTNLSVNRRKEVIDIYRLKKFSFEKKIANRPNLDGPLDDSLSILAFYSFSGHIICALINFACHPTMNRRNSVSSDFPGQLNKILMDNFGDNFVSCFMQGFSGNVKALSIVNSKFSIKKPFKSIIELLFDPIKFKKDMDITEIQNYSKSLFNKINWDFEWKNINPKFSSNNILLT